MCLDYCKKCGTNKAEVNPLCFHCHSCCDCVVKSFEKRYRPMQHYYIYRDGFEFAKGKKLQRAS